MIIDVKKEDWNKENLKKILDGINFSEDISDKDTINIKINKI